MLPSIKTMFYIENNPNIIFLFKFNQIQNFLIKIFAKQPCLTNNDQNVQLHVIASQKTVNNSLSCIFPPKTSPILDF